MESLLYFLIKTVFGSSLFSLLGACTFKTMIITQATSLNHTQYPITNKLYSLTCRYYCVVYKKTCSQTMIFISFSTEKKL